MLTALLYNLFGFADTVHLVTGKTMMSANQVEVQAHTGYGENSGCSVYETESKGGDEAAQSVRAYADTQVKQYKICAGSNTHLVHWRTVNSQCMAGGGDCTITKAKEKCSDEKRNIGSSCGDNSHGNGHAD